MYRKRDPRLDDIAGKWKTVEEYTETITHKLKEAENKKNNVLLENGNSLSALLEDANSTLDSLWEEAKAKTLIDGDISSDEEDEMLEVSKLCQQEDEIEEHLKQEQRDSKENLEAEEQSKESKTGVSESVDNEEEQFEKLQSEAQQDPYVVIWQPPNRLNLAETVPEDLLSRTSK